MATVTIRPPSKFAAGGDFTLWCKRFELYCRRAKIPEEVFGQELMCLLEDEPFRVVDRLGLTAAADYAEIKKSLEKRYAPEGNELLWQSQFQVRFHFPKRYRTSASGDNVVHCRYSVHYYVARVTAVTMH